MKSVAWRLGIAGLIPFILLPLAGSIALKDWYFIVEGFSLYSAVILSFLGGIHWYDALCKHNTDTQTNHQIYVAMLPSIIAWGAVFFLPMLMSLFCLSISYLVLFLYDKQTLTLPKDIIIWYTKLRMVLTTVVVLSHGWMIMALS